MFLKKFSNKHEVIINDYGYPASWDKEYDDTLEKNISVFKGKITNVDNPIDASLYQIYRAIRSTKYERITNTLRTIKDKQTNDNYKKYNFSYATFSGTFIRRENKNLKAHTGLICIDLDDLEDDLSFIKEKLIKDRHTVMLFTSPNGNGLKLIFRMNPEPEKQGIYYKKISKYICNLYKIPQKGVDKRCNDVSRACFLPHDPNIFIDESLTLKLFNHG